MVLNERLRREVEKILPESQAGFREGRGTIDHVYTLNYIVEKRIQKQGGKTIAFFADCTAAFDTIDREILWKILEENKVNKYLIKRCQEVYEETINVVRVGSKTSEKFWTEKGVRQGCPMSPTLFAAYISQVDK